jgi:hypothetical protein
VKIISQILLFFFIVTISVPTINFILDFEDEISLKLVEENEKSKDEKELKIEFIFEDSNVYFAFNDELSSKVSNRYLLKDYNPFTTINIMPPKV